MAGQAEILASETTVMVGNLRSRFADLPTEPYPERAQVAAARALRVAGVSAPLGIILMAVSPRLPFNQDYRDHLDQVAVATATALGNALAYERERQRAEALAELDRAKTQFFSNISHEFRTPLTLMLGPLQELLEQAQTTIHAPREEVDLVYRNGLRLLRLVNALLDFSRIEAGRVQVTFEPVDLSAFTADLASLFRSAIEKAGIRLVIDVDPLSQPVYVDRPTWEKVVLNLLSNAFKFTFEGEVRVTLREAGSHVELQVSDTGTGIPAEALPRLFERFYRVDGAEGRSHEGSGIGLSLVKELVRIHGGTVDVTSELGLGSTFRVRLPQGNLHLPADRVRERTAGEGAEGSAGIRSLLAEVENWIPDERDEPCPAPQGPVKVNGRRARVLLADDNTDMRGYVERLLSADYEVQAVKDGAEAFRAAKERRPDLVLSDVMMPVLDGFGLLAELRRDPDTQSIPVILLSARAGGEAQVEGLEAGADDYLVKPFVAKELLARVRANLELSRLRDQLSREEEGRRSAVAMERQWRLFDSALSHTPDFTYLIDLDGRFTYANLPLLKLWGKPFEAITGKNFFELGYPDDLAWQLTREVRQVIETGEPVRNYTDYTGASGETRHYEYILVPVKAADGRMEAVAGATRDITERRQAEAALRESEARFRAIVSQATAGIAETDLSGRFLIVNDRFCLIAGRSREQLLGTSLHDITHFEDRAVGEEQFERLVVSGEPFTVEQRYVRPGSGIVWVSNSVTLLRDPQGQPQGIVSVTLDTTEQHTVESALRRANASLEQFAFAAAHDLQEPARNVGLFAQMLARDYAGRFDPEADNLLNLTLDGARRMQSMIRDLLSYTQATAAPETQDGVMASAEDALAEVRQNLQTAIAAANAVVVAERLPSVGVSHIHLVQLLQNLISNSMKYRGVDAPRIRVAARMEGRECVFSVEDNGEGIAPEHQDRIFRVFKRLHGREIAGTGIGLAICERIVTYYGGRIWVESTLDRGSTFHFSLPINGEHI